MAKEQIGITLDDYHKWAIQRIAATMHTERTDLIVQAVKEWVARYPETGGWINHWTWVREDPALPEAPIDWVSRYQERIWTRRT